MLIALLLALQEPVIQRYAAVAVASSDGIYLLGGSEMKSHEQVTQVDVFNPQTGGWRQSVPLEIGRDFAAATRGIRRDIVFAGGLNAEMQTTGRVDFFNLDDGRWLESSTLPVPVSRASAVRRGLSLIVTGGIEMRGEMSVNSQAVQQCDAFSKWSRGPDLPYGVHGHTTTVIGSTIYVVAGAKGEMSDASTDVLALNEGDKAWRPVGQLPTPRMFHGTVAYKGALYIFGNRGPSLHPTKFDPRTCTATDLKCEDIDNHRFACAQYGDKVYFFGGEGPDTRDRVFDLAKETWIR
jgi:N-acetylneuraminic acid mutarotase